MTTEPFWKISKNCWSGKNAGTQKPTKCEFFLLGNITKKRWSRILASFQKLCPGIKTPKKDELIILSSPLGPKSQADFLKKKIIELEKSDGIVEKLDAHYGFYVEKLLQSARVVVLPENQYMFQSSSSLGKILQNRTRRALQCV